jgi:hypothetical protein
LPCSERARRRKRGRQSGDIHATPDCRHAYPDRRPGCASLQAQTAQEQAACRADDDKFCKGTTPGGGRLIACLAKQKDKLSDSCRKVVEKNAK